jgi:hypothetical protein
VPAAILEPENGRAAAVSTKERSMTARRYLVARRRSAGGRPRWTVEIDGRVYGEYCTEEEALLDAIDLANEAGQQGMMAEAARRSSGGECRTAWVFGRDGLPSALQPA